VRWRAAGQLEYKEPKTGFILYDMWFKKYVKDYYEIHTAFIGLDYNNKMPKWDHVIASFEMLDGCRAGARGSDHSMSWDHFKKALKVRWRCTSWRGCWWPSHAAHSTCPCSNGPRHGGRWAT